MEVKHKILKAILYSMGLLTLFFCMISVMPYFTYRAGKKIYKNQAYGIGVFEKKVESGSIRGQTNTYVYFDLDVNGKSYKNLSSAGVNRRNSIKKGEKFLVVYDSTDVKRAALIVSYPIKDDQQFEQYMKEFETKPLDISPFFRANFMRFIFKDYSND